MEIKTKRVAHNKLSWEQVKQSFLEVHGEGNYEYDKESFVDTKSKISIHCKKHNFTFPQLVKDHKKGMGCSKCGRERQIESAKKGNDKFIKELIELHGDIFDTSRVDYKNNKTEVELICKVHGSFFRKPCDILNNNNACNKCKLEKSKYNNKELFIQESTKLFGDITDYSKVGEISASKNVNLRCTVHDHYFNLIVSNRLGGQKCPKCAEENYSLLRKKSTEQFINEAKEIYGDLHDYTDTVYTGCRRELEVRCKKHDFKFKAYPNSYLDGYTCFKCRHETTGYKGRHHHTKEGYTYLANGRTTYLYLIKCSIDDEEFYKIGKTFRSMKERFTKTNMPYNYEVISIYNGSADKIWDLEEKLHKKYKKYKYKVKILFDGYSECYNLNLPIEEVLRYE